MYPCTGSTLELTIQIPRAALDGKAKNTRFDRVLVCVLSKLTPLVDRLSQTVEDLRLLFRQSEYLRGEIP